MLQFVFISFHYQHQHYTTFLPEAIFSLQNKSLRSSNYALPFFSNLINNSSIISYVKFFSVKILFCVNEIKFHLNFKDRINTFTNGRKGVCFPFPKKSSSEESLVVSLIIVQVHTPTFGQTPETICFNFD